MHIAIVDDHDLFGEMLKIMLNKALGTDNDILLYTDPEKLLDHFKQETSRVDLLFIDMMMPQMTGKQLVGALSDLRLSEPPKIIMLSAVREYRLIKEMLLLGVDAYLNKRCTTEELLAAIEHTRQNSGRPFLSEDVKELLIEGDLNSSTETIITLSAREQQLLNLMCEGRMAKEMAYELDLSLNTIHYYTKRLMKKMGVNRTPDLIIKAIKMGLFVPNENSSY